MKTVLIGLAILGVFVVVVVVAHMALIEIGREVVTLRTQRPDGTWQETRLWVVDDGEVTWLHSGGAAWRERFEGDPVVELKRGGEARRYRAHAAPGPHPRVDRLLREKYGVADRWVRFIAPDGADTLAVRLDALSVEAPAAAGRPSHGEPADR